MQCTIILLYAMYYLYYIPWSIVVQSRCSSITLCRPAIVEPRFQSVHSAYFGNSCHFLKTDVNNWKKKCFLFGCLYGNESNGLYRKINLTPTTAIFIARKANHVTSTLHLSLFHKQVTRKMSIGWIKINNETNIDIG